MSTLTETIRSLAKTLPEGKVISAKEFLHLGSRAAVDQALARLVKEGVLVRVMRGVYAAVVVNKFGPRPPFIEEVLQSLSAQRAEAIVTHGAVAANGFGLTQQVPVTKVFLTSGRTRQITIGKSSVQVRHAPPWMLALGSGAAGAAVRALGWLGKERAGRALAKLHASLPQSEWQALVAQRAILPGWMARAIGEEAALG